METVRSNIPQAALLQSWEDLLPNSESPGFDDPFAQLNSEQLERLAILSRIRWLLQIKKVSPEGSSAQEAKEIEQSFVQMGIDVNWLLSQRDIVRQRRIEQANNPANNGRQVKLPGLILPLAWDEAQRVSHFLLLPELGPCSHVPTPPANQVVYVKPSSLIELRSQSAQENPIDLSSLWMWVKGTLRFEVTVHKAYRLDGWLRLESSYKIDDPIITPCTSKDRAEVFAWRNRAATAQLYPKLTELIEIGG